MYFPSWLHSDDRTCRKSDIEEDQVGASCVRARANVDHLLLHCKVANKLCRVVLNLFGCNGWCPVKEALQSWTNKRGERRPRAWSVSPLAIMWVIWKERNGRACEGLEQDFVKMQTSMLSLVSFWCTYDVPICIEDWISYLWCPHSYRGLDLFVENHILV